MNSQTEHTNKDQKASYVSPELKVYGTIAELTHAGAATIGDTLGGSQSSFDLVAPSDVK